MANANKTDRRPVFQRLNIQNQTEQVIYTLKGDGATFAIYPALDSNFPELTFQITPRKKTQLPGQNPVTDAFKGWIEYNGATFPVVALNLSGVEFFEGCDTPGIVCAFDSKGNEVCRLQAHSNDPKPMFSAIRLKMNLERTGEPLTAGNFKTTASDIDLVEMTQTWSAVFNPPKGLEPYRTGGDARDLRRNGIDPAKHNHFRGGKIFAFRPQAGREYTGAIVEIYDGSNLAIVWDNAGAIEQVTPVKTADIALVVFSSYDVVI